MYVCTLYKSHEGHTLGVSQRKIKETILVVTFFPLIQLPLIMWPKLHTKETWWQTEPSPWQLNNFYCSRLQENGGTINIFCQITVFSVKNKTFKLNVLYEVRHKTMNCVILSCMRHEAKFLTCKAEWLPILLICMSCVLQLCAACTRQCSIIVSCVHDEMRSWYDSTRQQ